MFSSLDDLRLVETARLILHESHDGRRLDRLRERIEEEGVQRNPVIVAAQGEGYLVLDGAHRVHALRGLGCALILAQIVELPPSVESWAHLLDAAALSRLRDMEEVEVSEEPGKGWLASIEPSGGRSLYVRAREEGVHGEVRALWRLQEAYAGRTVVHRVAPDVPVSLEDGQAIIRYRSFSPEELAGLVSRGEILPAGITRFRIPERVLGVRYPLDRMKGGDPKARNAELRAFVREHWEANRIRYYDEPVVLFE